MLGFIYKDFLIMRKQLIYILFLVCIYSILAALDIFSFTILSGIVVVLGAIGSVNAFGYDKQARWDKFAAATPAGRRGIVSGRYLFAFLLLAATAAVVGVVQIVFCLLNLAKESLPELLLSTLLCTAVGLLLNTILLPLVYKFGVEKARYLGMIVFVVVFGTCIGMGHLISSSRFLEAEALSNITFAWIVLGLLLAAVILFSVSYQISLRIFARKEL